MLTSQTSTNQSFLYETDYHQWLEVTIKKIQEQEYSSVDWDNLIEEISGLSRSEKRKLRSLLTRLLEHLLKLAYWTSERDYNQNHWQREIYNFRLQLRYLLRNSPSLKSNLLEILDECYEDARNLVALDSQIPLITFPMQLPGTLEQILASDYFFAEQ